MLLITSKLRSDRNFALRAIRLDGIALNCVSKNLRDNREITLLTIRNTHYTLQYALAEQDRDFLLEAMRVNGLVLCLMSRRSILQYLTRDKDMLIAAINENLFALSHLKGFSIEDYSFITTAIDLPIPPKELQDVDPQSRI